MKKLILAIAIIISGCSFVTPQCGPGDWCDSLDREYRLTDTLTLHAAGADVIDRECRPRLFHFRDYLGCDTLRSDGTRHVYSLSFYGDNGLVRPYNACFTFNLMMGREHAGPYYLDQPESNDPIMHRWPNIRTGL